MSHKMNKKTDFSDAEYEVYFKFRQKNGEWKYFYSRDIEGYLDPDLDRCIGRDLLLKAASRFDLVSEIEWFQSGGYKKENE